MEIQLIHENVQKSNEEIIFVDKLNFHEISDFLRAKFLSCQLDEFPDVLHCETISTTLMNDSTSNHWSYFPEVLKNPVSYSKLIAFLIIWWDLQVEYPAKEDVEYFIFELWSKLGRYLNSIDGIAQAEILGPKIEQILLDARVSSIDDRLSKSIHNWIG